MVFYSHEEASAWCESKSIRVSAGRFLRYQPGEEHFVSLTMPQKASQAIALANYLIPNSEESPFRGGMLWFREWGIWNEHNERTGEKVIQLMRRGSGEERSLRDAPAQSFGEHELFDLHAYLVQALTFGWDAFVIPNPGNYFVFCSHDEVICLVSRSLSIRDAMFEQLASWGPQKEGDWYLQGID